MKIQFVKTVLKISGLAILLSVNQTAYSKKKQEWKEYLPPVCTTCAPHWYAGANIGFSHLYDRANPGTGNSVNQNGPGWSVDGGYQMNDRWGLELGYTHYYNSRETFSGFTFAKTEHHSAYLAATLRCPLERWNLDNRLGFLGKLGLAYSYANKMAIASGGTATGNALSPYAGLGLTYMMTPKVDFITQWAGTFGNHLTGSAHLWSIGLQAAIV